MTARDEAFLKFYEAEAAAVGRFALLLSRNPEVAADLAQEAFIRTYGAWNRVSEPRAYVRQVVLNLVRKAHRRRAIAIRHPQPVAVEQPDRSGEIDDALRVAEALAVLPPVRRAAVVLRYYEDLPLRAVADVLGRPLGTVKSDLHRALAALRDVLVDESERAR